ncbi:MAG: hypothetical protein AAF363_15575 [Bacteroidota bacterium]
MIGSNADTDWLIKNDEILKEIFDLYDAIVINVTKYGINNAVTHLYAVLSRHKELLLKIQPPSKSKKKINTGIEVRAKEVIESGVNDELANTFLTMCEALHQLLKTYKFEKRLSDQETSYTNLNEKLNSNLEGQELLIYKLIEASLSFEYSILLHSMWQHGKIEFIEKEKAELATYIKESFERFGAYTLLSELWEYDIDAENHPWINNIGLLCRCYEMEIFPERSISFDTGEEALAYLKDLMNK